MTDNYANTTARDCVSELVKVNIGYIGVINSPSDAINGHEGKDASSKKSVLFSDINSHKTHRPITLNQITIHSIHESFSGQISRGAAN